MSLNRLGGATENARPANDGLENDGEGGRLDNADRADVASAAGCCCGSRSWTAVLLLLVDVDAVVVVANLSEKPGAVYPEAVVYGAQKTEVSSMSRYQSARCMP